MEIKNSNLEDFHEIFHLYKIATDYQKERFEVHWPDFDQNMVKTEIAENRQWKMCENQQTACVWVTTFSDPEIWEERNNDPAIYIHRIAVNPLFRGKNLVLDIVEWAKIYAKENDKKFVRMDTVGNNLKLIEHYVRCGFKFLGLSKIKSSQNLPAHYQNATLSLFELAL
ncbi:MAG: GNAT family N-acetyltransferase [Bacteroidetes bacterium]|nr:MAG: GNAT family N-acetyltransferase [Bacteroidota bacterium]